MSICTVLFVSVVGVERMGRGDDLATNPRPSASLSSVGALKHCWDNAMTQLAMDICAADDARSADEALDEIYQRALSRVRGNAVVTRKIMAAQRAWVTYRDSYLNAMFPAEDKQKSYGTEFPMQVDTLRATLARKQAGALICLALGSGHLYTASTEGVYPGATVEESTQCNSWLRSNQ
jgi:uncharacterized protein YecT (DUF1311 family)